MEKTREKDIRELKRFCVLIGLAAAVFCILYLFNIIQNEWVLDIVLVLGIVLHTVYAIVFALQKNRILTIISVLFIVLMEIFLIWTYAF